MQPSPGEDHELRIARVLDVVYRREGYEIPDNRTPLTELIVGEGGDENDAAEARQEIFARLLHYFFADGPHPAQLVRRVYAVTWALKRDLLADMSQTEIAMMLGETKAAMSYRVKKIFERYIKEAGCQGTKVPGQKSALACRKYAEQAKGNQNRKKHQPQTIPDPNLLDL